MLPEKIKSLRKKSKMSQERLAEKLGVSRQAVTKWETGTGTPDINNLKSIASLFGISIDKLLEGGKQPAHEGGFLFDSLTEYDIDGKKNYDIKLTGAKKVILKGYYGEKITVRLASSQISDIKQVFKIKIDDIKNKIDMDMRRAGDITEAKAKEALFIFINFPISYVKKIELSCGAESLEIKDIKAEKIEISGKIRLVCISRTDSHTELDCNSDMVITCSGLTGRLDINQISASSKLVLPAGTIFAAVTRGIGNKIFFERDGKSTEDFSLRGDTARCCKNIVELNGIKSELIINAISSPEEE